jgi:CheY-like chemotaxis protein
MRELVSIEIAKKERWPVAKLILIVDDDVDVATSMADVLEAEGYRVTLAANGKEALDVLRREDDPDLILLDVMMPVMDGWRFREEQQKLPAVASIPVITVTADGNARQKAAAMKAADYLEKPFTVDRLLDVVERVCGTADA